MHSKKSKSVRYSSGASSSGGEVRSNESLLAVVKRSAPAIQFCYENELKKNPGLRGKLVVSLTVLADGSVRDAGVTSFRIPFLFTPPE